MESASGSAKKNAICNFSYKTSSSTCTTEFCQSGVTGCADVSVGSVQALMDTLGHAAADDDVPSAGPSSRLERAQHHVSGPSPRFARTQREARFHVG